MTIFISVFCDVIMLKHGERDKILNSKLQIAYSLNNFRDLCTFYEFYRLFRTETFIEFLIRDTIHFPYEHANDVSQLIFSLLFSY